jgi:hypothetical protein
MNSNKLRYLFNVEVYFLKNNVIFNMNYAIIANIDI